MKLKISKYKRRIAEMLSFVFLFNLFMPGTLALADVNTKNNLVKNSTYLDENLDSKPDYWNVYAKGNNYDISISNKDYKKEPNSLVINLKDKNINPVIVHQTVKLSKDELNKKYIFTEWIKTENFKGVGAHIRLQIVNSSNQKLDIFELSPKVNGNSDWKELKYEVDIPDKIGGVEVCGLKIENYTSNNSTGKVYFNNPTLTAVKSLETSKDDNKGNSILENNNFEIAKADGTPDKWGKWESGSSKLSMTIDKSVFKEGKSSVKIENSINGKTGRGTLNQTIRNIPDELQGKSIKVSQFIKTENFKGKGLTLRLQYKDPKGNKIEPMGMASINVNGTMDWKKFDYIINLPKENIGSIIFEYLYDDAEGKVWIDDVNITKYVKLNKISVNPTLVKINKGENKKLSLTYNPSDSTDKDVTFESSNTNIATVDKDGVIKGINNGTSNIIIKHKSDNIKIEVPVVVGESDKIKINDIGTLKGKENKTIEGKVEGKSLTGLQINYSLLSNPSFGDVDFKEDGSFTYYPNKDYSGKDSFTVVIKDKDENFAVYKVDLEIEKVNKAPEFKNFNIKLNENELVNDKDFNAKDPEGDKLTFEIVSIPKNGKFTINKDKYSYKPNKDFNGYDSVKVKVKDSYGNETIAEGRIFVAPSLNEIKSLVKNEHPRLLASKDDFNSLKNLVKTDKNAKEWFNTLKKRIDNILTSKVVPYNKPDGLRLDTTASKNIVDLSFMYRITGDKKYADRALLELENVCLKYPDWSYQHFLDATMTSFGVSIGYDWLYDYMNDKQKEMIENALVKNCLSIGLDYYKNNSHFFVEDGYNWNFVCNTGLTAGALAIMGEKHDKMAEEIVQESFKSIQNGLTQYYPEGDSIEGISYWDYGTRYLVYFLSSVSSAMKGDNPFINAPGIKETPDYPIFMTGKDGEYNYSDNDKDLLPAGYLSLWFAKELNRPDLTWYHKYYMSKKDPVLNVYDLLWYKPSLYKGEAPKELDKAYPSRQAVITMRKDFKDPNSSFVGFKGGLNGSPHGDLDIGSFVYDSLGVRWALDLGKGNYNLPGYWEKEKGGRRWNYYRKRAEGHNTLIINPGSGYDQEVGAFSPIIDSRLNNTMSPYGIIDMTKAYEKEALDIKRGIKFINRKELLIRDEYKLKQPGEIAWQMHTNKDIQLVEGGKAAILKEGNKRLYVKILTKGNSVFEVLDAKSYSLTKNPEEKSNAGIKKLVVKVKGKEGSIDIWMSPFIEGEKIPTKEPVILALKDWKNEKTDKDNPLNKEDKNLINNKNDIENKESNKDSLKSNKEIANKVSKNNNTIDKNKTKSISNNNSSDKIYLNNKDKKDLPKTGTDSTKFLVFGILSVLVGILIKRR